MERHNLQSIERNIRRLSAEINRIDALFYGDSKSTDRFLYAGMLERKRDDMVRCAVLQLHTSIEDLLTSWLACRLLGIRPDKRKVTAKNGAGRAARNLLYGARSIGFDMKLNLAAALKLISPKVKSQLEELNLLRNKCSHYWLLNVPVRRGKRPAQKKPPLLSFRQRNLYHMDVLGDFLSEYGPLYSRLFVSYHR